jgi:ribosomal protein L16/L10AE
MMTYLDKKLHSKYNSRLSYKLHILRFSNYGIKSLGFSELNESKIIFLDRFLAKNFKTFYKGLNTPKYWNRIQINSNTTSLSPESRMGKGKGSIKNKIAYVYPGQILFEFSNTSEMQASLI